MSLSIYNCIGKCRTIDWIICCW